MGEVVGFRKDVPRRVRACQTCRYRNNHPHFKEADWWQCGISGLRCVDEAYRVNGCGPEKTLWEPVEPKENTMAQVDVLYLISIVFGSVITGLVILALVYYLIMRG